MWPQHQRSESGVDEHLFKEICYHAWLSCVRGAGVYTSVTSVGERSKVLYWNGTLIWFCRWSGLLSACWFTSPPLLCCETWLSPPLMFRNHFPVQGSKLRLLICLCLVCPLCSLNLTLAEGLQLLVSSVVTVLGVAVSQRWVVRVSDCCRCAFQRPTLCNFQGLFFPGGVTDQPQTYTYNYPGSGK